MKPGGVFLILFVLAIIAGIVVWAVSRAQRLFRAQYAAMILVAKARSLRFSNDPDPDVRIHMEGTVEGIPVQVQARVLRLARHTEPILEVVARGAKAFPKGVTIKKTGMLRASLVAEGEGSGPVNEMLQNREFQRAMEAVTEPGWGGSPGEGRMDHDGVQLQKGGYQGDPEVINEMIDRAVRAYKCYEDLIQR